MIVCSFTPSRIGTICSILLNPAGASVCGCCCANTQRAKQNAARIRNSVLVITVVIFETPECLLPWFRHAVDRWWTWYKLLRVCFEKLHAFCHGSLKLRIVTGQDLSRGILDFDIWRYTDIFDIPFSLQVIKSKTRSGYASAVDRRGSAECSNQTAPGSRTNERAELSQPEVKRESVTARPGRFVNNHHLRTVDTGDR